MVLTRGEKIALEEYFAAAEALGQHFAGDDRPPRVRYLVRQLADARDTMLRVLRERDGNPKPEVG